MKTLIIIFISLLFISCDNNETQEFPFSIETSLISKGALYGNGAEGIVQSNFVINNQSDWDNLITKIDSYNNVSDNFVETNIDFSNYIVLAVFDEIQPTNNEININSIVELKESILVTITHKILDATVTTQPYHIVKIPMTEKLITFETTIN